MTVCDVCGRTVEPGQDGIEVEIASATVRSTAKRVARGVGLGVNEISVSLVFHQSKCFSQFKRGVREITPGETIVRDALEAIRLRVPEKAKE